MALYVCFLIQTRFQRGDQRNFLRNSTLNALPGVAEAPVKLDDSFPSTIFIAGVPKVSKEKYDKLFNVLSKLINKCLGEKFLVQFLRFISVHVCL